MTSHFSGAHGPRGDDNATRIPVSDKAGTISDRAARLTSTLDPIATVERAQTERKNLAGASRSADRFIKPASFR